jgi:hypothetical protein
MLFINQRRRVGGTSQYSDANVRNFIKKNFRGNVHFEDECNGKILKQYVNSQGKT